MSNTNARANEKLFETLKTYTLGDKVKSQILESIATHYGISQNDALAEVTTEPCELLFEYIPDRNLATTVYNMMASREILVEA